jgi:hypothetical protein
MQIAAVPGVTGTALLDALRATLSSLENVRGSGGTSPDRLRAYQLWSNGGVRRLGALIRSEDLNRLVTTPRYWALQALTTDKFNTRHLADLVDLELDERLRALRQQVDDLDGELDRWNGRRGHLVMPDTNVYLHHDAYFDEVPWTQVLEVWPDGVHLFVALLVVDELDRAKRTRGKKVSDTNPEEVRTRARVTLRRINDYFHDVTKLVGLAANRFPETGTIAAELLLDGPGHVRLADDDSELVDRARSVQDLAGRVVTIVTFDTGMAFRARSAGLEAKLLNQQETET